MVLLVSLLWFKNQKVVSSKIWQLVLDWRLACSSQVYDAIYRCTPTYVSSTT